MSEEAEKIKRAILSMVNNPDSNYPPCMWATVKSVSGKTCVVIIDEVEFDNILLGFDKSGIVIYPVVGSDVIILFMNNDNDVAVVIYAEQTDKIEIMGNVNGGIVNVIPLVSHMNTIENKVNDLIGKYNIHTHTTACGAGAGTAAPTTTTEPTILTPTQRTDIENTNIKHGNG